MPATPRPSRIAAGTGSSQELHGGTRHRAPGVSCFGNKLLTSLPNATDTHPPEEKKEQLLSFRVSGAEAGAQHQAVNGKRASLLNRGTADLGTPIAALPLPK